MGVKFNQRDTVWAPPDRAVDDNGAVYDDVQAAVDNADDLVLVGPGTFEENVTIDKSDFLLMGSGSSTVIDGGTTGYGVLVEGGTDVDIRLIRAKTTNGAGNNNDAIRLDANSDQCSVVQCEIPESDQHGIFTNPTGGDGNNHTFIDVSTGSAVEQNGIYLESGASNAVVIGCKALSVGNIGIRVDGSRGSIMGCIANNTGHHGIQASGDDVKVIGCTANSVGEDSYNVASSAGSVSVLIGNTSKSPSSLDYDTSGVNGTLIARGNAPTGVNNDEVSDSNYISRLVDSPNGHIPNVVLDNGDSAEIPVVVPDGETLKVYRWGAYQITDGTTPTDLDVELKDGSDAVQATENTGDNESTDPASPVASHANSSGSSSVFKLAVANDTGSTISDPGVAAHFAYVVE